MNATTVQETAVLELEPVQERALAAKPQQQLAIAQNSPAAMMLAAMDRGATLEQVEKMMDLQDRWERREAEKAFYAALSGLRSEAIEVIKRKRVHFSSAKGTTDYKHAELSDVIEAAQPAMARHGLSHRWEPSQEGKKITVTCIVSHALGHSVSVSLTADPDDTGNKNPIQQVASTITYLERHTLKAVLGLSERGDDNDGRRSGGGSGSGSGSAGDPKASAASTDSDIVKTGYAKAQEGMAAWAAWFNGLTAEERATVMPHTAEMKANARKLQGGAK